MVFAAGLHVISDFVRHQCGPEPLQPLPLACPTADQLRICWPRNRPFYDELVMSAIPKYAPPVPTLMDAKPSVDNTVPLLALPGRSHPLLLRALGMYVPVVPAPLGGTPSIDDVVPDALALEAPAIDVPAVAATWRPVRRLLSKTSFEQSYLYG